jgi:hypothetical protein
VRSPRRLERLDETALSAAPEVRVLVRALLGPLPVREGPAPGGRGHEVATSLTEKQRKEGRKARSQIRARLKAIREKWKA